MGVKNIIYGEDVRLGILRGVHKMALAVGATMGPSGRNVIIEKAGLTPTITFDGVTVSKEMSLPDQWEDMGVRLCKEVSGSTNEDSGDGTTTATLLAFSLLYEALKEIANGQDPLHVRKGIQEAAQIVLADLYGMVTPVRTRKEIEAVAKIASESPEMAAVVADAMDEVGRDGIVSVEDGKKVETYLESTSGLEMRQTGYEDPIFINQDDNSVLLEDPIIFCFDGRLESPQVVANLMTECLQAERRSFLVIADDFGSDVMATLIQNHIAINHMGPAIEDRDRFPICAVKTPLVGRKRMDVLEDIAVLTGADVCSRKKGDNPLKWMIAQCGSAAKVRVLKNRCEIINGDGSDDAIQQRVSQLRNEIQTSRSEFDRQKLQERLGRLVGGMTVIRVGAHTETELREKKRRMEDALSATRAAMEEGLVPGGGVALFQAGQILPTSREELDFPDHFPGYNVVRKAVEAPIRAIISNAGYEPAPVLNRLIEGEPNFSIDVGFDVTSGEYKRFFEAGIVDPTKVMRCAFENAVSFATTVLMTSVAISEQDPEAARMQAKEI